MLENLTKEYIIIGPMNICSYSIDKIKLKCKHTDLLLIDCCATNRTMKETGRKSVIEVKSNME